MKNITWSRRLILSLLFAAAGSGLLLRAQNPQQVGAFAPMAFSDQRSHAASATLADGRTLIVGGFDIDGNATTGIVAFNPEDGSIAAVGELPAPRAGHSATALKDGRVLIAGGLVEGAASASLAIFNPADGTTTALDAVLTSARSGHAAARLADGTVLVAGGSDGSVALATSDIFDPETGAVAASGAMNAARAGASATLLIDNRVLVAGGNNGTEDLATAEIYYPFAGTWESTTTNLSVARSGHAAVLLPWNASVLIAGGRSNGVAQSGADLFLPAQFPDPYSYGMGTFVTTAPNDMSIARAGAYGGPYGDNGYAFVAGGAGDAERYRFATIKTDKDDYAPGEFAVITGSGWQPNETVTLLLQEDPPVHDDYLLTAQADAEGNFEYRDWAPENHDLGVRLYLMATGSQARAQTTFTDAVGLQGISVTPASRTISAGDPTSFSATVDFNGNGSAGCSATLSATGFPATGTSHTWTANPVGSTGADGSSTLNITTLVSVTPGTYSLTLTATAPDAGGGQGCNGGSVSTTATLTINTAATVNTTTSVTAASATYGDSAVMLNATVTPASGPAINSGSVTFTVKQGLTTIGVATTDAIVVAGAASVSFTLPAGTAAGPYTIQAEYNPGTGFNGSSGTGALTIAQRNATWTTNAASKTYGDPDPSPLTTGSGSNFLAADNVTAVYSRVAGENASLPTYHITATLNATPLSALDNYIITNDGAEFTINRRLATWTTNPASKTYGDPDPVSLTTGSGSNFVVADGVTATYSRVPGETVAGGPYDLTATLSATPLAALDNYTITNDGAEFTINKRLATWTTNPAAKTYGDADLTPLTTGSGSNFVAADSVTATYTRVAGDNASPPTYHITATLSATPLAALDNYIITNDGAEFTINKRLATWTTNPSGKTYGDSDPSPLTTGSGSNFLAADNVTATYVRAAGETVAGGPYQITATLGPAGVLGNYIITNDGANFTIAPRAATVKADNQSKTFGEVNPTLTATVAGTVNGDVLNYTLATTASQFSLVSPPPYPITVTLGSNPNYVVTPTNGSLTVLTACSAFNGFLSPIGGAVENLTGGTFNDPVRAFKLNSTIPVKFSATCYNAPLLTGIHTLKAIKYNDSNTADTEIVAVATDVATTGNQFRLSGSEWHFNLATRALGDAARGIWLLEATLFDGSKYTVWIEIKK